jgi:hypothetical protein
VKQLLPALRELARIYDRQINRGSLWLARRKLAKAETELGLLGWEQADFEGEAQRHIDKLKNFEREQLRMTNESAALGLAIKKGQEDRASGRKQYEAARTALEAEWKKVAEPLETAGRHLAARRKIDVDFDGLIAELDRELVEVQAAQTSLLTVEKMTPQLRAELSRVRERAVAIPNAQADLRLRRVQAMNDIRALEETIARGRPQVAEATQKLHALDEQFARSDGTLDRQIAGRTRDKEAIDRQNEGLEKAKDNPYRQIGQILADSRIAPMNQPRALDAVLHRRAVVAGLARAISDSHDASRKEDRAALAKSWMLLAALAAVVVAVGLLLAK